MTYDTWLRQATRLLSVSQVPSARLDALILLEAALGRDRASLLAHPEAELADSTVAELSSQLQRRANHEPLAYILGQCEFYGRTFIVSPATLQPRSETETMISLLCSLDVQDACVACDIGTGSGAIAITAKLELPEIVMHATDIQEETLQIAKQNAYNLHADITFHHGNLVKPLDGIQVDVLLANLPYVPNSHTINNAAMHEPAIAIFGGDDGLDAYREMFSLLSARAQKPKYILTESLPFQHADLTTLAENCGYGLSTSEDFIQLFRLIGS